ncbi:hypothetical protein BJ508DRAFT_331619 [Ascobolus immersus RN42]|uniref:F-box domain-containing protein n=1 Tax=Ascobolus immersus RN42 TaxID=1160509 RepID=A0A3N4I203_ASCIM|nr:hypothetical protein BJ508DRAFT_331619 [Ascobolus immersus RN42]
MPKQSTKSKLSSKQIADQNYRPPYQQKSKPGKSTSKILTLPNELLISILTKVPDPYAFHSLSLVIRRFGTLGHDACVQAKFAATWFSVHCAPASPTSIIDFIIRALKYEENCIWGKDYHWVKFFTITPSHIGGGGIYGFRALDRRSTLRRRRLLSSMMIERVVGQPVGFAEYVMTLEDVVLAWALYDAYHDYEPPSFGPCPPSRANLALRWKLRPAKKKGGIEQGLRKPSTCFWEFWRRRRKRHWESSGDASTLG